MDSLCVSQWSVTALGIELQLQLKNILFKKKTYYFSTKNKIVFGKNYFLVDFFQKKQKLFLIFFWKK